MRTTDSATSNVANLAEAQQVFDDTLFRNSKGKTVDPPKLPTGTQIADTHAHLDMLHTPSLALARAAAHNVSLIVTVVDPTEDPSYTFDNLDNWTEAATTLIQDWRLSSPPPEVRIIIGCHPHNASKYDTDIQEIIIDAVQNNPKAVGIGEIGLDYHYDNSPRDIQRQVFKKQIQLAHQYNTPIALHLREAHQEGLQILKAEGVPKAGALLHCFNLDYATLEPFLELGLMVAYGGPLTFKKSDNVRAAASQTPLDRLVTETDSPFMAPHPIRGTVCGPEDTIFTAELLAELITEQNPNLTQADALNQFYANAAEFFKIPDNQAFAPILRSN